MFFGMLRCKNEERWLEQTLRPLLKICETVYVLDDHSTDGTSDIIKGAADCVYVPYPFTGLDESRDKTYLLNILMGVQFREHDWVICIDGDEEICDADLGKLMETGSRKQGGTEVVSYSFQILTLYDSPDQIRVDGPYAKMLRPSMFRLIKPGMTFKSNARHGGGFHCSNVPADIGFATRTHDPEPVRVKHYGYMDKVDRERKYKFYVEHDPGYESWYRGECFGDPVLAPLPEGL